MALLGPMAFLILTFFSSLVLGFGLYHVFTRDVRSGLEAYLAVLFPIVFTGLNIWLLFASSSNVVAYQKQHKEEFTLATANLITTICKAGGIAFIVIAVVVSAVLATITMRQSRRAFKKVR